MKAAFPHAVRYEPKDQLTLTEIANSLIAQERIAARIGKVLQASVPGLEVDSIRITLVTLEISSLSEDFLVELIVSFQEDIERPIIGLIERFANAEPNMYTVVYFQEKSQPTSNITTTQLSTSLQTNSK